MIVVGIIVVLLVQVVCLNIVAAEAEGEEGWIIPIEVHLVIVVVVQDRIIKINMVLLLLKVVGTPIHVNRDNINNKWGVVCVATVTSSKKMMNTTTTKKKMMTSSSTMKENPSQSHPIVNSLMPSTCPFYPPLCVSHPWLRHVNSLIIGINRYMMQSYVRVRHLCCITSWHLF